MAASNGNTGVNEGTRDIGAMVERAREQVGDYADTAKRTLDTVDRRLSDGMRENPMVVLGVAVGVGYVIGRIFSKIR